MASCAAKASGAVRRQGRRMIPSVRRVIPAERSVQTQLTVGDLIAAAFDVLGDAEEVVKVLSSPEMERAIGRKIVFV